MTGIALLGAGLFAKQGTYLSMYFLASIELFVYYGCL
jgi:hypothetical protein